MTAGLSILAVAVALAAIAYLAATDPKRRRVFDLPDRTAPRRTGLALAVLGLTGAGLLLAGDAAAFVVWLGAASVAGWGLAALTPEQSLRLARWGRRSGRAMVHGGRAAMASLPQLGKLPPRVAALEARVAELERQLLAARPPLCPSRTPQVPDARHG